MAAPSASEKHRFSTAGGEGLSCLTGTDPYRVLYLHVPDDRGSGGAVLDKAQLIDHLDRLSIPARGRELVLRARREAPVRDVESRGGNVITAYASRKMASEIRCESRHIEFPAAVDHEYDPAVLEYYAQPCKLHLELFDSAANATKNIQHYPDFLVIREDSIVLEEWKSEEKLNRLAEKYPYRYVKGTDGFWSSPQIERQLAALGIRYRICSGDSIPRVRVENYLFLADYLHPAAPPCPDPVLKRLNEILCANGAIYLDELFRDPYNLVPDEVFKAIAERQVVANLDLEPLSSLGRCRLYRDTTLREFLATQVQPRQVPGQEKFVLDVVAGSSFQYEGQELTISLVSEKEVVFSGKDGSTHAISKDWLLEAIDHGKVTPLKSAAAINLDISCYTQAQLETALRRQSLLRSNVDHGVSGRTLRRWAARQAAAIANGANDVLALVPKTSKRGNRTPRLSESQETVLQRVYEINWRSNKAPNYKACYRYLQVACDNENVKCPSYPTLINYIKRRHTNQDLRIRHGKRMAYQLGQFVDVLYADTPVHGSRPFQYVHIDHTQLDIELISSRTGKPLGRPWLSIAVDAWSRRIVGIYLTFDSPSYASVMMVVRDMVRRFERLPETIVVDNGKDFASEAFESFLMVLGVNLRFRPAGRPRHGSVMERLFGRLHTEYVHNLGGNTKDTKNVRMTTGKHLPVNFAEWTLEAMYVGIEYWATEFYDQERHVSLDMSPREAYQKGLVEAGERAHRRVLFNLDFKIATCPPVEFGGQRQVNRQTGVKVKNEFYWNPDFSDSRIAGQRFPVRYDPWDAASVYVRIKERWVHAQCRKLYGLGQLTKLELEVISAEHSKKSGNPGDGERSRQRLHEFMQIFSPSGALALELDRETENKTLYNQLNLSYINPAAQLSRGHLLEDASTKSIHEADSGPEPPQRSTKSSGTQTDDPLPDFDVF